jgi:hypothetical protein
MIPLNWATLYASWWVVIPLGYGVWLLIRWLRSPGFPWYARSLPPFRWAFRQWRGR